MPKSGKRRSARLRGRESSPEEEEEASGRRERTAKEHAEHQRAEMEQMAHEVHSLRLEIEELRRQENTGVPFRLRDADESSRHPDEREDEPLRHEEENERPPSVTADNRRNPRETIKKLPLPLGTVAEFDDSRPKEGFLAIEVFVRSLESATREWTDRERVILARQKVTGTAAIELSTWPDEWFSSWDEMKGHLLSLFRVTNARKLDMAHDYDPKIKVGESVAAFARRIAFDLDSLSHKGTMDQEEKDSWIRRLVRRIIPPQLDGYLYDEDAPLKKMIRRLQYVLDGREDELGLVRGAEGITHPQAQVAAVEGRNTQRHGRPPSRERGRGTRYSAAPRPSPRGSDSRNVTCWSCGTRGHTRDQCPLPDTRRCFACGGQGHLRKDCGNQKNGARPSAASGASGGERNARDHPGGRRGPPGERQGTREWQRTGAVPRRNQPAGRREPTGQGAAPPTPSTPKED